MTVIAWDGKTLVTDRQATVSGTMVATTKSRKLKSGVVLAWAGSAAQGLILADLFQRKLLIRKWPEFQREDNWTRLVIVRPGREASFFEQEPVEIPVEVPYYAWGSGKELALGAMYMGANARDAVLAACKWENTCGLGLDEYEIPAK